MNQLSNRALMMYFIASAALFGSWVVIEFNRDKVPHPGALIGYIQNTLAALGGHIFTMINSLPAVTQPAVPQQPIPTLVPTIVTRELP